jgi:chitin disaccharide deacetylase
MSEERRLVVNADDFGLSAGVNAGILRAHREGIVTSASLMVRAPAAVHAVAAAAANPQLDVGLHVDLGEWSPDAGGDWRPRYEVVDLADEAAVVAELERQVARFCELAGRPPTHMDSHQHVHRFEPVRSAMGALAKALGIPLRHHGRVRYCGDFYGAGAVGAAALAAIVERLPPGATELCCHPAAAVDPAWDYAHERRTELASLCHATVRDAIARSGVRLCTFAVAAHG